MPDMNSPAGIVVWSPVFAEDVVTFAAAGTLPAGTVLARDSVTLKLVPFTKGGGTNGAVHSVLPLALAAAAPGDVTGSVIVTGRLRRGDLLISGGPLDNTVVDAMRSVGLVTQRVQQLAKFDNTAVFTEYQVSDGVGGFELYQVSDGGGGFEPYQVNDS